MVQVFNNMVEIDFIVLIFQKNYKKDILKEIYLPGIFNIVWKVRIKDYKVIVRIVVKIYEMWKIVLNLIIVKVINGNYGEIGKVSNVEINVVPSIEVFCIRVMDLFLDFSIAEVGINFIMIFNEESEKVLIQIKEKVKMNFIEIKNL